MKERFYKHLKQLLLQMLMLSIVFTSYAQEKTVTGQVTSVDEPGGLPGVNIQIKGTMQGTITDTKGNYTINTSGENTVLVFSSVGYAREEIVVGDRSIVDVVLVADIKSLEEIVVVGYGVQKKANLTGAVDMITSERFENRAITNVGEGLQGLIPNLNVTIFSGDPSQSTDLNVRGFESINGGEPLVLVDGVPMDLNRVNPQDIESITVLKDAAAGAVYGARAAFGVILVETKKGTGAINVR